MPAGNQATQVIFLVVIVGAFYFLLIRPQRQQQKRQQAMVSSLEAGAEIMTIGGIYATIVEVGDERLRVRTADGSELELAKRAVASVVEAGDKGVEDDEGEEDAGEDVTPVPADADRDTLESADAGEPADRPTEHPEDAAADV